MPNLTPQQRATLEELNRRAKRLAREARPAYRLKQERRIIAYRIIALSLFMILVMVGLMAWYL